MRETSSNTREIVTCERLRQLKMSGMADAYEKQLNDPNADLTCFEERFAEIVEREWQIRYDKKFNRLLKLARLRYPSADIDEPEPELLVVSSVDPEQPVTIKVAIMLAAKIIAIFFFIKLFLSTLNKY